MTRYIDLPTDFRPQQGHAYGGLEALVNCAAYLGEGVGHRWCEFMRLAPGTAAVYPVKVQVPERGEGPVQV